MTTTYPLVETLVSEVKHDVDRGLSVTIVAKDNLVETLMKAFLSMDYKPISVEFDTIDYNSEYYVSVYNEDNCVEFYIEPAWHEKSEYHDARYFDDEADITYVNSDSDDDIYNHIHSNAIITFTIE